MPWNAVVTQVIGPRTGGWLSCERRFLSEVVGEREELASRAKYCVGYTTMDSGEVVKRLEREGWAPRKGKGSHRVFTHPTKPGIVVVPHPRKDLMVGTLRNIYRQAGWRWGGR